MAPVLLVPTSAWGWRDATSRPSQVIQILAFLLLLCLLGELYTPLASRRVMR